MNYKESINLPKTSLAMKANLTQKEPLIQKKWQNIYQEIQAARKDCNKKILHDGPPYATGDLHIGTGMNKVLKDIIVRYWTMKGYQSPYVPGWDCHGLPIEHKVMKQLGNKASQMEPQQIRRQCKKYAQKYVTQNKKDFQSLGISGDWSNPYLTYQHAYEKGVMEVFAEMVKNDLVYRDKKSIHWCINCTTALAEAELEYQTKTSPAIYVKFPLSKMESLVPQNAYIVIWTTTPWTLPANMAVAIHSQADYALVKTNAEFLIVAKDLVDQVMTKAQNDKWEITKVINGKELQQCQYQHIFSGTLCPIVAADYVSLEEGTGCVHTAPGHGRDDYHTGLKYGLDIFCPVDEKGRLTEDAGVCVGDQVFTANPKIIELLLKQNLLFSKENYQHEYPHCWRCKSPIIFRATHQWFVAMDKPVKQFANLTLREKALEEAKKVRFVPQAGGQRFLNMLQKRPDWCISRQRHWGIPIPGFYCQKCNQVLLDSKILNKVIKLFAKKGADTWFTMSAKEILGDYSCSCGASDFCKENDIFDVWFESGASHHAVCRQRKELAFPAELYFEGTDQHRGWFQLSMLCSVGAWGTRPYQTVVTHGFVVDEKGHKMSKSAGNFISVEEMYSKYGSDIFRLWCFTVDYTNEIKLYPDAIKRQTESYRKLRNTFRFLLGNLHDFNFAEHSVPYEELEQLDQWILAELEDLASSLDSMLNDYSFHQAFQKVYRFCIIELSGFYFLTVKDSLYCNATNAKPRKSVQTAMYKILDFLVKILAPILVHTCEEIWEQIPYRQDRENSVHLTQIPDKNQQWRNEELKTKYRKLLELRDEITPEIEKIRAKKGVSNQTKVKIYTKSQKRIALLESFGSKNLSKLLIIASLEWQSGEDKIYVEKTDWSKCVRCWNYLQSVGDYDDHPELCERCYKVVL